MAFKPIQSDSGYVRAIFLGGAIALGWSPCIGPILGFVLVLAATSEQVTRGALLLLFFGLGLGTWFLVIALGFQQIWPKIHRSENFFRRYTLVNGILLTSFGALLLLGGVDIWSSMTTKLLRLGSSMSEFETFEQNLVQYVDGPVGLLTAFLAGILAFASPCVLPMVPVFFVHIGGELALAPKIRQERRRFIFQTLIFILAFSVTFAVLGASVGLAGGAVLSRIDWALRPIGAVVIILGLNTLGLINLPFVNRTYQL